MTDIFLSYSSADRERVEPICDSLTGLGFEVFWDQQVPAGVDWDTWIRQRLSDSKCAIVAWSATSVQSRNVRHEATVAAQQGKLVGVLLDPLSAGDFPMGLYSLQAVNLNGWAGDESHAEWGKLRDEVEAKLTPHAPLWIQRQIHALEADWSAAEARVKAAESRARQLQEKIGRDAQITLDAQRERDNAAEEIATLKAKLGETGKSTEALRNQINEHSVRASDALSQLQAMTQERDRHRDLLRIRDMDLQSLQDNLKAATDADANVGGRQRSEKPQRLRSRTDDDASLPWITGALIVGSALAIVTLLHEPFVKLLSVGSLYLDSWTGIVGLWTIPVAIARWPRWRWIGPIVSMVFGVIAVWLVLPAVIPAFGYRMMIPFGIWLFLLLTRDGQPALSSLAISVMPLLTSVALRAAVSGPEFVIIWSTVAAIWAFVALVVVAARTWKAA